MNNENWEEEFVEKGADLEHDRWGRWQKHMFSKGTLNSDGTLTIPKFFVERWFRQIETPYAELSDSEKESDRKETRQYLSLVESVRNLTLESAAKAIEEKYSNQIATGGVTKIIRDMKTK